MSHGCHCDIIYIVVAKLLKVISSTFSLVHLLKWEIWPNCNFDITRKKFQNGKDSAFVNFGECFIQSSAWKWTSHSNQYSIGECLIKPSTWKSTSSEAWSKASALASWIIQPLAKEAVDDKQEEISSNEGCEGRTTWLVTSYWVQYCGCSIFMIFSQFDDEDAHTSSLTSQVREFLIKLRKWLWLSSLVFIWSIAGASGDHKFTVERRLLLHEGNNASWRTNRRSRNPWWIETDWEQWQGCIQTAADLLDKLDETADPCDDFYQFACGSFIEETVIPDDRTRTSMFSILGDKLDVQVRGLLEGEIKASDPKPFQMAKSVFQSCMDKETIEVKRGMFWGRRQCVCPQAAGLEPLKVILKKLGGWPLLEGPAWNEEGYKW